MRSLPLLVVSLALLSMLTDCGCATPQPIVRLEPRTVSQALWVSGRAVLEKEIGGVRVATAFELQDGKTLGVRVEIENDTAAPFEVSPGDITFMTCPAPNNQTCVGSWNVVDPEEALEAVDEQQSRAVADANNRAVMDTTLVLLSAAADVGQIATGHTDAGTGVRTAALAANGQANIAAEGQQMSALDDRRALWSNTALRRNTIAPGHGAAGLVFLPIDPKAEYIWLHVRAGGQIFPFGFRQTVRQVRFGSSSGRS
jgi:hypothetical protein